jgi:hypothetical protein
MSPQEPAAAWARIDRDVTDRAPWVPFAAMRAMDLTSSRTGNYVFSLSSGGALLAQLWVR